MKKRFPWRILLVLLPFCVGTYGFCQCFKGDVLGAAYNALRLYGLDVDIGEENVNIYIEIARWLAILATASVVAMVFERALMEIKLRWKLRNPELVVVHGDGSRMDTVAESLGNDAIPMSGNICFKAKKHILAFESDVAAIRYLQDHEEKLFVKKDGKEEKEVYFAAYEYEPSDYAQTGMIISNNAANCARSYWEKNWIRESNERKIGIIGFGEYGQRILEQALVVNLVAWRPPIEYHVFGNGGESYLKWRPRLSEVIAIDRSDPQKDSIFFHPSIGEDGISNLEQMDRIILSADNLEENMLWLNRIICAGIKGKIHIRGNKELLDKLQYMPQRQLNQDGTKIATFGGDKDMYTPEVLMHGVLCKKARQTHITYVQESAAENIRKKYESCNGCMKNGKCGDCLCAKNTWNDLTYFEKASNVAAADHEPIKRYMLAEAGRHGGLEAVHSELCRIEHERWLRFYLMHNWRYGEKRDDGARIHPCLLPFDQLSHEDQKKDWWSYNSILNEKGK